MVNRNGGVEFGNACNSIALCKLGVGAQTNAAVNIKLLRNMLLETFWDVPPPQKNNFLNSALWSGTVPRGNSLVALELGQRAWGLAKAK
jgi:hypothetical protein